MLCFPFRRSTAIQVLRHVLILSAMTSPLASLFAQVGRTPPHASAGLCSAAWTSPGNYGRGKDPAVALTRNGFFIEEHSSENGGPQLYYKLGRFVDGVPQFGPTVQSDTGSYPTIAINSAGIVVDVHQGPGNDSLYYRVGHVNIDGDIQTERVVWNSGSNGIQFDNGYTPSISMNDDGVIAIVWRTTNLIYPKTLYSMYGLVDPKALTTVNWIKDAKSEFDKGIGPHIAIDSANEVLEVHKGGDASDLHYRRAFVNVRYRQMGWVGAAGNSRYVTGNSTAPAVTLTPAGGNVIETHSATGNQGKYMIGQLDPRDVSFTAWSGVNSLKSNMASSSVTSNDEYALEVNSKTGDTLLEYSYTRLSCP